MDAGWSLETLKVCGVERRQSGEGGCAGELNPQSGGLLPKACPTFLVNPTPKTLLTFRGRKYYKSCRLTYGRSLSMKVLLALLQIAAVASSLLSLRSVLAQEQAAAPIFQEGDTWQFKVTDKGFERSLDSSSVRTRTHEIAYTNGDFQVYLLGEKRKQPVGSETRKNLLLSLVGKAEGEALKAYLQFPLFVGKEWRIEYNMRGGRRRLMQGGASVIKMEDISTQAGNFRTFKIERGENGMIATGTIKGLRRWFFTSTYYYSSETQSIVKLRWEHSGDNNPQVMDIELIRVSHTSRSTKEEAAVLERSMEPVTRDR